MTLQKRSTNEVLTARSVVCVYGARKGGRSPLRVSAVVLRRVPEVLTLRLALATTECLRRGKRNGRGCGVSCSAPGRGRWVRALLSDFVRAATLALAKTPSACCTWTAGAPLRLC